MKKIAKFEKVSYNQFKNDFMDSFPQYNEKEVEEIYHSIQLPKRATKGSAGYDFYSPIDFELNPGQTIKIPTGIRVRIENGWVLGLYPRSGLGFKYRLQLNNTVGIIDSDYYNSDNEGHMFVKLTNDSNEDKSLSLKAGQGMVQGIFFEFGIVEDDDVTEERNGALAQQQNNYVYIVRCRDQTLYTGWTNQLEKRIEAHNAGKGAKYTKARRPVELVYFETFEHKSEALKREYQIKQLKRSEKEKLILSKKKI